MSVASDTRGDTPLPRTSPATWPAIFADRVREDPDAVAVVFESDRLTYGELDERADRLARRLVGLGAGPERVVALALPRSIDLVVAQVAVLKAGAAYLPLEPDHPLERLRFLLADAAPMALVSHRDLVEGLPDDPGIAVVLLDEPEPAPPPAGPADPGPAPVLHPHNTAYVIYTSGTTGRPKAVLLTHTGVAKLVATQTERFGIDRRSRILQFASVTFDVAFWDLCLALLSGGRLVVVPTERRVPGPQLTEYAHANAVTFMILPPVLLAALPADLTLPPAILLAGTERVSPELVGRWGRDRRMFNAYGPTEATVNSTLGEAHPDRLTGSSVPIGVADPMTDAHVLDDHLRPVPAGTPGELYLGGPGLARGYLNQPGLTAARFVADPYGAPGARLYRTGDVVSTDGDGNLHFLGRVDDQVKINGYRIEPGEIESVLLGHDAVAAATVQVHPDRAGRPRLVAYLVAADEQGGERDTAAEQAHVGDWKDLHELLYAASAPTGFDEGFAGWNSTYDGLPIPLEQMRAWRAGTVARIRALRPRRVLELGVGSGLIMSEVAPYCDAYWGTDVSEEAVAALRPRVGATPALAGKVTLDARPAHDLSGLPGGFDLVVINSVVQYFPSGEYLRDVLRGAAALLAPGGAVFVGDVRNPRLLRAMRAEVQRVRSGGDAAGDRAAVDEAVAHEGELLVDPDFFPRLAAEVPGLGHADVRLKPGGYDNELSRHRYDAVLHAVPGTSTPDSAPPDEPAGYRELPWSEVGDLDAMAGRLRGQRPVRLRVTGVPNALLHPDLTALARLDGVAPPAPGVDPAAFEALGLRAEITWTGDAADGAYDVRLSDPNLPADPSPVYRPGATADRPLTNVPARFRDTQALVTALRGHAQRHLPPYLVPSAFVLLDALPVTTSGKLDRAALPAPEFGAQAGGTAPRTPREEQLCAAFSEVLAVPGVGVEDDFFALGGDSIVSIQLVIAARAAGLLITARQVFEHRTVAALAPVAQQAEGVVVEDPSAGIGPLRLTPIMRWLDECGGPVEAYSQSMVASTPPGLTADQLGRVLDAVIARHGALRSRIVRSRDGEPGVLHVAPPDATAPVAGDLRRHDVAGLPTARLAALIEAETETAARRLDPEAGVMARYVWFDAGPERPGRLLMVVQHWAIDGVSWRILLPDLARAWALLTDGSVPDGSVSDSSVPAGGVPALPPAGTSLRRWSELVHTEAGRRTGELGYWTGVLDGPDPLLGRRPLDKVADRDSVVHHTVRLAADTTTALLTEVPAAFHGGVNDGLLTALALAVRGWRRDRGLGSQADVLISLEGHGREEQIVARDGGAADLSQTVGWFTSVFPVRLHPGEIDEADALRGGPAIGRALRAVKEQLRELPDHGVSYGLLRYLNPDTAAVLSAYPEPQIVFNYLGRFAVEPGAESGESWTAVPGFGMLAGGFDTAPAVAPYLLEINSFTEDSADGGQRLAVTWSYPSGLLDASEVSALAEAWFDALRALVAHVRGGGGGHTPSDLSLLSMDQDEIDEFEAEWDDL